MKTRLGCADAGDGGADAGDEGEAGEGVPGVEGAVVVGDDVGAVEIDPEEHLAGLVHAEVGEVVGGGAGVDAGEGLAAGDHGEEAAGAPAKRAEPGPVPVRGATKATRPELFMTGSRWESKVKLP